jgi:hypothetical protein
VFPELFQGTFELFYFLAAIVTTLKVLILEVRLKQQRGFIVKSFLRLSFFREKGFKMVLALLFR